MAEGVTCMNGMGRPVGGPGMGGFGGPGDERPEMPEGGFPEGMELPKMPEEMEKPKGN